MQRLLLCLLMLVSGSVLAQPAARQQNMDRGCLATNQTSGYKIYRWKTVIVVDAGAKLDGLLLLTRSLLQNFTVLRLT